MNAGWREFSVKVAYRMLYRLCKRPKKWHLLIIYCWPCRSCVLDLFRLCFLWLRYTMTYSKEVAKTRRIPLFLLAWKWYWLQNEIRNSNTGSQLLRTASLEFFLGSRSGLAATMHSSPSISQLPYRTKRRGTGLSESREKKTFFQPILTCSVIAQ